MLLPFLLGFLNPSSRRALARKNRRRTARERRRQDRRLWLERLEDRIVLCGPDGMTTDPGAQIFINAAQTLFDLVNPLNQQIDFPDIGWVWVDPNAQNDRAARFRNASGTVVGSRVSNTDFPTTH